MRKILSRALISSTLTIAMLLMCGVALAGTNEKLIYSFSYPGTNGLNPMSRVLYASGRLYGTTSKGGTGTCSNGSGCGVVFALGRNEGGDWSYERLYSFQAGTDAQSPVGDLVLDSAGNLYGAAEYGGANGFGAVYKLTRGAGGKWMESVIYSFGNTPDGSYPYAGLTIDAAGNLYGTTNQGGTSGFGTVYELAQGSDGSWSETVLHNFAGAPDGLGPEAGMIFDAAGNLYGTTTGGGNGGAGTVFELSPNSGTWSEKILYGFPNFGVGVPLAPVYMDSSGNLYGTGKSDGEEGSAYELTPGSGGVWTETTLVAFGEGGNVHGDAPYGGLVPDGQGNLYGTTDYGGSNDVGLIFKLTPAGNGQWTEYVAHSFTGFYDGAYCAAGLTAGEPGTFYGTTAGGGTDKNGAVFEFKP